MRHAWFMALMRMLRLIVIVIVQSNSNLDHSGFIDDANTIISDAKYL